jgi:arylsulfatase A-like enzyme
MALEQTGTHRLNGIFMFSGEPFAGNKDVTGARIIDLAPTILYQMGVPIPEDMDGKILDEIFTKDYLDSNRPVYVVPSASASQCENMNTYSESESQEVAERLRNLGYLE